MSFAFQPDANKVVRSGVVPQMKVFSDSLVVVAVVIVVVVVVFVVFVVVVVVFVA